MIWHIAKRELSNNLNSLRFALATVLLLGLMLTNAIVHLREHPERVQRYSERASGHQNNIAAQASNSLYDLAQKGPGNLYKKPSDLRFCAEGGEAFMSDRAQADYHRWSTDTLKSFWILAYPSATPIWIMCVPGRYQSRLGFHHRLCFKPSLHFCLPTIRSPANANGAHSD